MRVGIAVAALLLVAIAALLLLHRGRFGPALLSTDDALVLTEVENRTGDKSLDGSVAEGLQIELAQSPYLRMVDREAYRRVRHLVLPEAAFAPNPIAARKLAEKLNAKAFLYGSISGAGPPYLLHVDLSDVSSNDILTSAEEHVSSPQQIPGAIDRLAAALRFNAGEERDSIAKTSTSLAREATTDLNALQLLSAGEEAYIGGRSVDAVRLYQQAVELEPRFVQAQLHLAVLYRKLRAELAAGEAARLALAAADSASERTRSLAQFQYEMNASGDYARAVGIVRQVVARYPHDAGAMEELARGLRLEGRFTESVQMAQQAYAEGPYLGDAYMQAENSMIALDRYDAAAQLAVQAEKLGLARPGGQLTSAYLEGRQDTLDAAIADLVNERKGFKPDWNFGLYLDNVGRLAAGATVWRGGAAASAQIPGLESAAAFLLSQGALDRANAGRLQERA